MLAQDGATVAVLGLPEDQERTHSLAARLNGAASRIYFYQSDVSVYEQCRKAVAEVFKHTGASIFWSTTPGSPAIAPSAR